MDRKGLGNEGQAMAEYVLLTYLVVVMGLSVWLVPGNPLSLMQLALGDVLANVSLPMP